MSFVMKVGVALSGGGIRGIAHAGVLQALLEEQIPIDIIRWNQCRKYGCKFICNWLLSLYYLSTF